MQPPPRDELARRLQALPAARPLVRELAGVPGVHVVGGSIRDLLLGGQPADLDLVVEGDPAEVRSRLGGEIRQHDRFGTFSARRDGFTYDVARARREHYPRPGALPEVQPAPLSEDLDRRDFTVNAMAVGLTGEEAGELRSVPGALDDLGQRLLRVLHDRSFEDDPTRLMRLARYRGRLGFAVEDRTLELATGALQEGALETISGSRLGAELRLVVSEPDPVAGLRALRELGLDKAIHPHFGLSDPQLASRGLALLPRGGRRDRLALAAAAMSVQPDQLEALLDRLAFEASDRRVIVATATRAPELARRLAAAGPASEIAAAALDSPDEQVALAGALGAPEQATAWLGRLSAVRLEIRGEDLLAAGVPQGPLVGQALRAALAAKLDGQAQGRAAELAVALAAASQAEGR